MIPLQEGFWLFPAHLNFQEIHRAIGLGSIEEQTVNLSQIIRDYHFWCGGIVHEPHKYQNN